MRWIFLLLVLVNVALYLWASGHPDTVVASAPPPRSEVNPRGMMLLAEMDDAIVEGSSCVRIGPFASDATFTAAARKIADLGLDYSRRTSETRELRTFRVFAGPFESEEDLEAMRNEMNSRDVDTYLLDERDGPMLSLGVYSQPAPAAAFVAELASEGVVAHARPEVRTLGPLRWLEARGVGNDELRTTLESYQWDDAMARMSDIPAVDACAESCGRSRLPNSCLYPALAGPNTAFPLSNARGSTLYLGIRIDKSLRDVPGFSTIRAPSRARAIDYLRVASCAVGVRVHLPTARIAQLAEQLICNRLHLSWETSAVEVAKTGNLTTGST